MSHLSLATVEKLIKRNLPYIDVSQLDATLKQELSHTERLGDTQEIRQQLIDSFRRSLDETTVAYIRDKLLRLKETQTETPKEDEASLSIQENASSLDLNLFDQTHAPCFEICSSSISWSVPIKRRVPCVPSFKSYPLFPITPRRFQEEENDDVSNVPPSLPSFQIPWEKRASTSGSSETESIQFPKVESKRYKCSVHFVKTRKLDRIFSCLATHLLLNMPCDPVKFLIDLVEQLIRCRDEGGAFPILYGKDQLNALFDSIDLARLGYISLDQYRGAMKTLGVTIRKPLPSYVSCSKGIPHDIFRVDAKHYLMQTLIKDVLQPSLEEKS